MKRVKRGPRPWHSRPHNEGGLVILTFSGVMSIKIWIKGWKMKTFASWLLDSDLLTAF